MTELEKMTAWHNAAKALPILQKLFPPSESENSGKFLLWSANYYEYEAGKWSHHGWDEDDHDSVVKALGGDGAKEMLFEWWSTIGCYCHSPASGAPLIHDFATTYQWYCAHPDRAEQEVPTTEMEEWAKDRIPSIGEIIKALEESPINPDFPDGSQLTFGGI